MSNNSQIRKGGCTCGHVRYQTTLDPMIVHGCHCQDCQKSSGAAFAINALFERDRVELIAGDVKDYSVPTPSGRGQIITRCSKCKVAVWSTYYMGGLRDYIRFIRVGTLDGPDQLPPDIHIYTCSKQPWVILANEDRRVEEFYEFNETWRPKSMKRLAEIKKRSKITTS